MIIFSTRHHHHHHHSSLVSTYKTENSRHYNVSALMQAKILQAGYDCSDSHISELAKWLGMRPQSIIITFYCPQAQSLQAKILYCYTSSRNTFM